MTGFLELVLSLLPGKQKNQKKKKNMVYHKLTNCGSKCPAVQALRM
jgi:hypothetical protein